MNNINYLGEGRMSAQKGITIVSLVITVIVLLIISGIGISAGTSSMKTINDSKLVSELEMVQHAVLEQYTKYKTTKDSYYLLGHKMDIENVKQIANEIGITLVTIPSTYNNSDYYRLDKATLQELGITKTDDEYIVNYISGEVINISKKKNSKNAPLYVKSNSFINE